MLCAMNDNDLWKALDALRTYDSGHFTGGPVDEFTRARVKRALKAMGDGAQPWIARRFRDVYLSDEAIEEATASATLPTSGAGSETKWNARLHETHHKVAGRVAGEARTRPHRMERLDRHNWN